MTSCLSLKTALVLAWAGMFYLLVFWVVTLQHWYPKCVVYKPSRRGWVHLLCSEHCHVVCHHLWRHLKELGTEAPAEDPKESCLGMWRRSQPQLAIVWNGKLVLSCCLPSRRSSLIVLLIKTEHIVGLTPYFFQVSGHGWIPARCLFTPAPGPGGLGWGDASQTQIRMYWGDPVCHRSCCLCSLTAKNSTALVAGCYCRMI